MDGIKRAYRDKELKAGHFRNFVFGVEDSVVSTVGLLSGIAIAGVPNRTILVSGVILILVEAFSMAIGSFLSEYSEEEYLSGRESFSARSLVDGSIMFFSYFVSGFVPLFPYVLFGGNQAFWISIFVSLITLFCLGVTSARFSRTHVIRSGIRMFLIGGFAIAVGVFTGSLLNSRF